MEISEKFWVPWLGVTLAQNFDLLAVKCFCTPQKVLEKARKHIRWEHRFRGMDRNFNNFFPRNLSPTSVLPPMWSLWPRTVSLKNARKYFLSKCYLRKHVLRPISYSFHIKKREIWGTRTAMYWVKQLWFYTN